MKFVQCNGHILNASEIVEIERIAYQNSKKEIISYSLIARMKNDSPSTSIYLAREVNNKALIDKMMDELMQQLNKS